MEDLVEEGPGSLLPGSIEELVGRGAFDDLAVIHEDDPVGHLARESHFVGNADHGDTAVREFVDHVQHLPDHLRVEGRCRLVEQQDVGFHA